MEGKEPLERGVLYYLSHENLRPNTIFLRIMWHNENMGFVASIAQALQTQEGESMEANPVRIVQYFDGEKQSIIPLFQRPYTWDKRNWESLWLDILSYYEESDSGSSHFMGAVVSIPAKTVPVGVTKHLIIDGQQRLTTIAILLCSLRDCSDDDRRKGKIQDYLVNRHYDDSEDYLKLLPTQGDRKAYRAIVIGKSGSDEEKHPITDCYDYFKKILMGKDENDQQIDLGRVLEIVKSQLQVVMINLGEVDDPYLIFESLNFKGEPLSQADLVRNYILMQFRSSLDDGGEQKHIYQEIWHPMELSLGVAIEDFLWHYAIKDGDNVKKPKLYAAIKHKLKESGEIKIQIQEMSKASTNYVRFLNPEKESNSSIKKELILLDRLSATIAYPILLKLFAACDNNQFNENVLLKCLRHINSFILRRAICDEKRSALNKVFVSIASRVPTDVSSVDEWLAGELGRRVRSERWPDDNELKNAILTTNLYGTKAAKIFLEGIESYIAGKEVIDLNDKITIEHIMPQTINSEWRDEIGHDYSDEIHNKYLHTLGNLTLTGYNSELGNLPFSEKKKKYLESGISMNRDLCRNEKWWEVEILRRAATLADYAIKIWAHHST
jgi:uncharacterized protein with ParB-like and HNH nuclease domain